MNIKILIVSNLFIILNNLVTSLIAFAPLILILHCIFIFIFKKWLGPIGTFYGSIISFTFVLIASLFELFRFLKSGAYAFVDFGRWFYCLDLVDSHLVFCIDGLALISASLVLTLTMFALHFGVEYMYREAFINRLLYLLNLFATSVVFLFFCYDYFLILFSWECIGLFSLLLVNFYSSRIYTLKAALKTFVFSRISDMFMFLSFLLTISVFSTTDLSIIFLQVPFMSFHYFFIGSYGLHFITFFSTCLVLSGGIKAAQFFSHVWLPDAMEAPTPASALIHSSTLVVAGIFLVIRFSVLFEFTVFTNYLLALLGALTLSFGAITATFQNDIKKLVAYSTISQIGYLVCGCGFCCYEEVLLYLIIHALNKAFLFVLVGYTVHFFSGNTDLRQMGGAYLYSFDVCVMLFGVCFNLAGLPYSAGFLGKEFLLFQVLRDDFLSLWVRGCWLVSFFFTPIYMLMLVFFAMFGVKKGSIVAYRSLWNFSFKDQIISIINFTKYNNTSQKNIFLKMYRVSFTAITSRSTSYLLLWFWIFFFFFGESLLLILFNYTTITDSILSSSFFNIKQHTTYFINSLSTKLEFHISCFIFFLTTAAISYLSSVNYATNYTYFNNSFALNVLPYTVLIFTILL